MASSTKVRAIVEYLHLEPMGTQYFTPHLGEKKLPARFISRLLTFAKNGMVYSVLRTTCSCFGSTQYFTHTFKREKVVCKIRTAIAHSWRKRDRPVFQEQLTAVSVAYIWFSPLYTRNEYTIYACARGTVQTMGCQPRSYGNCFWDCQKILLADYLENS